MSDYFELVEKISKGIKKIYNSYSSTIEIKIKDKGAYDEVTSLDFKIEEEIIELIKTIDSEATFLSEEYNSSVSLEDNTWVIDPIDGTCNFTHGIDTFGIQCALYSDKEIKLSIIYLPFNNEMYTAIKGEGARLNGQVINCSNRDVSHSLVSFGDFNHSNEELFDLEHRIMRSVSKNVERVRMYGAASIDLTYLATGRLDANFTFVKNPWDIAPGVLLCQEAGAVITDVYGKPFKLGKSVNLAVFNSEENKDILLDF